MLQDLYILSNFRESNKCVTLTQGIGGQAVQTTTEADDAYYLFKVKEAERVRTKDFQ